MGVALGVGAALWWGAADYFAAVAGRSVGSSYVVLGFHLLSTLALGAIAVVYGLPAAPGTTDILLCLLAGVVGWISYAAFYRALAIGPISVVSPIVSGYAVVTTGLAVLLLGDRVSRPQALAIVVSIAGVTLAASDRGRIFRGAGRDPRASLLSLAAMLLIGLFVFLVAREATRLGWLAPLLAARAAATVMIGGQTLVSRTRPPAPTVRAVSAIALVAAVDTLGYVCFNLGVGHTATAVVAAASSPYAVVPVLVGVLVLRERPTPAERLGVLITICGVVGLGVASL